MAPQESLMTKFSLPPGLIISYLEMRGFWKMAFVGSLAGQRFCASLWFCFGVLRKKEEKNPLFFEKLQMLCERFQAETPGSYSNSSLEKLLFSFPDLRVKAALKSKSWSNSLDCQDFGGTRTFIHCSRECKMVHCSWKAIWRHL